MELREPGARYLVKPAFKRSDAGLIPVDWELMTLGSIADVSAGSTPSRKVDAYWGGHIPWVTTAQIDFNDIREASEHITELGLRNSATRLLSPGTLLMALYGQGKTRGKVARLGIEATTNQACASIAVGRSVSADFVFHSLASQYESIRQSSNSGSQDNLNGQIVKSIRVPLPSSRIEQEAIAEALSNTDALIESLEQLLAKKRQIKQGTMQELLTGQRRLPGFQVPWETRSLKTLATMNSGGTPSTSNPTYFDSGGTPWVSISDLTASGKWISTTERSISRQGLRNCTAQTYPAGTVLYAMYASLGECSIAEVPLASSQAILGIQPTAELLNEFLYYYLQFVRLQVKGMGQQGTQANLNKGMVQAFQLALPSIEEQTAIATTLSDMDAEISALQARLAKVRQLKQGMMQALLTGRIRLVPPQEEQG